MTLDLDLGVDLEVTDEPEPAAAPTATDTGFLVMSAALTGSPTGVTELNSALEARNTFPGEVNILAYTDAFFNEGGARLFFSPIPGAGDAEDAVALFTDQMGPGQLVAPTVVAAADQEPLRDWAWAENRIYVASVTDGSTVGNLQTQATALIDDLGGRNAMLEADTLLIPGVAPGTTREVSAAIVKAAHMARSDIATDNPNLAAAGNHTPNAGGQCRYVVGIKNERSAADQKTLATSQVNCYRTVNNRIRGYGYFTLADLDALPHWWDMSGSRTIMAIRAREQAVAEELMFGQVDATNAFLDRYQGALAGELADLQRRGAIYGSDGSPGYSVVVAPSNNPVSQVATGLVMASIVVKTSPFAGSLKITLSRRAITQPVEQ